MKIIPDLNTDTVMYSIRGNCMYSYKITKDDVLDPTWTVVDKSRAQTIEARLTSKGVTTQECETLVPCIVWKSKFPGLMYDDAIEARIRTLAA